MAMVLWFALIILKGWGVFNNPILGSVVIILIILSVPITWYIKEYLKKRYPQLNLATKCPVCGFEIPDDKIHCDNCGTALEGELAGEDEFSEDVKVKKICPYCGLKELETVYEIGRGYREVCASCGKSRVSRKAIKITLTMLAYLIGIAALFYWLSQTSQR